jgi:hypothetical protein
MLFGKLVEAAAATSSGRAALDDESPAQRGLSLSEKLVAQTSDNEGSGSGIGVPKSGNRPPHFNGRNRWSVGTTQPVPVPGWHHPLGRTGIPAGPRLSPLPGPVPPAGPRAVTLASAGPRTGTTPGRTGVPSLVPELSPSPGPVPPPLVPGVPPSRCRSRAGITPLAGPASPLVPGLSPSQCHWHPGQDRYPRWSHAWHPRTQIAYAACAVREIRDRLLTAGPIGAIVQVLRTTERWAPS